jgi:flagellar motor switch protein FliG
MAIPNLQKAALLLTSLSQTAVAQLLEKLSGEQAAAVRREMDRLSRHHPDQQKSMLQEFAAIVQNIVQARNVAANQHNAASTTATAAATRENVEPVRKAVAATQKHAEPVKKAAFLALHPFKAPDLAAFLADEQPQTIALVLFFMPVRLAADTIALLPPERQTSIVRRMADLIPPDPEIVRDMEQAVERRLWGDLGRPAVAGMRNVVKILNAMPPAGERRLLGELARLDPPLFGTIRRALFGADIVGAT